MPKLPFIVSFSPVSLAGSVAGTLFLVYLALIATVMSYAALTVEYAQHERSDEATVAALEAQYLSSVSTLIALDYAALGYAKPSAQFFVPAAPVTALR